MSKKTAKPIVLPPLRVVRPIGISEEQFFAYLDLASRLYAKAKNKAISHWYSWAMDNDWHPGFQVKKDGTPRIYKGRQVAINNPGPPDDEVKGSTVLYRYVREVVPELLSSLSSSAANEVYSTLTAKLPYNHSGLATTRWQAVMSGESALPNFRCGRIPVLNNIVSVTWDSALLVNMQLFAASENVDRVTFEAGCKTLKNGHKEMIRDAIGRDGSKFCDSELTQDGDKWYLLLKVEREPIVLPSSRAGVAELVSCAGEDRWPFNLVIGDKRIPCGFGIPVAREWERLTARIKHIGALSRDGLGTGHGRKKFYEIRTRKRNRFEDVQGQFRRSLISRVMSLCESHGIGELKYREPRLNERDDMWFGCRGVPFNWTRLETDIAAKCLHLGIKYVNCRKTKDAA